jgi:hypothetical protein
MLSQLPIVLLKQESVRMLKTVLKSKKSWIWIILQIKLQAIADYAVLAQLPSYL